MGLGMTEIVIIFLVILLLFGAKRLPEVARAMGRASNEFKKAKNEVLTSVTKEVTVESEAKKKDDVPKEKSKVA
jgi:sec-independent protein translocase protein TatA